LYLFRFRKHSVYFGLACLVGVSEVVVTSLIWFWAGISVAGFYF
jgi:hypothetical protein